MKTIKRNRRRRQLLISKQEVADILGVCTRTVERMVERKQIYAVRPTGMLKGAVKFRIKEVYKLIGEHYDALSVETP
jgi:excisionase family DNA binding protein